LIFRALQKNSFCFLAIFFTSALAFFSLRKLLRQVCPLDHGLVLRTDAARAAEADIRADVAALEETWADIEQHIASETAPALLYAERDLAARTVLELLTEDVEEVLFDSAEEYERCRELAAKTAPGLESRLKLRPPPPPLFDSEGVEDQVREALAHRVALPSGGRLTFDETEALTTIDVDTAGFVDGRSQAATALQTNLEAVKECARQIRLRDLGGIIVIDFLDMDRSGARVRGRDALQAELERDRMHPRIVSLSPLGLVELTRRRRGPVLRGMG
jgi:ribonuclease G